ncbi:MAG: AzlC family ABC transporter permease [Bifidobacteriaceae bacterium]|nr:AzlC family ABC transporter permease [Bifidobacteriaceae bacterium]
MAQQAQTQQPQPAPTSQPQPAKPAQPLQARNRSLRALKACFPFTIPVMAGYVFLGITYGILMVNAGMPVWLPMLTAAIIYTGSMEFLLVQILTSSFNPLSAFVTALMVGARHLFYGIAMLGRYRDMGRKKPYLIFSTTDETFAVNYSTPIPADVDRGWFYLWVSVLDQCYWVTGSALGAVFGSIISFNTTGLDFVMTTMFAVIFLNQWLASTADAKKHGLYGFARSHAAEIIGLLSSLACLLVFGPDNFIVPSMVVILVLLTVLRTPIERSLPVVEKKPAHAEPVAQEGRN